MTALIENPVEKQVVETEDNGVVNNKRLFNKGVKALAEVAESGARAHVNAADLKRQTFEARMAIRVSITYKGRPDFGGNSNLYKSTVADVESDAWTTAGLIDKTARDAFNNSVQQAGLRSGVMEREIVGWLTATITAKPGTEAFKKAVRAEYKAAGKNIPKDSDYSIKVTGGPAAADPKVTPPADILDAAIDAVHTHEAAYDELVILNGIHRMGTELAAQLKGKIKSKKLSIAHRPECRMVASDLAAQFEAILAIITGDPVNEDTFKTLDSVAWKPLSE